MSANDFFYDTVCLHWLGTTDYHISAVATVQ